MGKFIYNITNNNREVIVSEEKNRFRLVRSSYDNEYDPDVVVLLKDLTNVMHEMSTADREILIQHGTHYSEMLPMEKLPTDEYFNLYKQAIERNKEKVADHVIKLGLSIAKKATGKKAIIVSLARAGIPVGILVKDFLYTCMHKYVDSVSHYTISIIRDKGIDVNAMEYIYSTEIASHNATVDNIFFIDGWTGKGVINQQLHDEVDKLKKKDSKWKDLSANLYVLADPANVTEYCATRDDYLLPSACLNSTVSGLLSRTILNKYIDVANGEFHGAVYFEKFKDWDVSKDFIDEIKKEVHRLWNDRPYLNGHKPEEINTLAPINSEFNGMDIVRYICNQYGIKDYKKVKPGIGETTRVLLRRVPWIVFINKNIDENDPDILHIISLCKEKGVEIRYERLGHYKVCGVIKELSADA